MYVCHISYINWLCASPWLWCVYFQMAVRYATNTPVYMYRAWSVKHKYARYARKAFGIQAGGNWRNRPAGQGQSNTEVNFETFTNQNPHPSPCLLLVMTTRQILANNSPTARTRNCHGRPAAGRPPRKARMPRPRI